MSSAVAGSELVEVVVLCPSTDIMAVILRPAYKTAQTGMVVCPHCEQLHPYQLDYDPKEYYGDGRPGGAGR